MTVLQVYLGDGKVSRRYDLTLKHHPGEVGQKGLEPPVMLIPWPRA